MTMSLLERFNQALSGGIMFVQPIAEKAHKTMTEMNSYSTVKAVNTTTNIRKYFNAKHTMRYTTQADQG
jgi:hypothetical protein